MFHDIRRNVFMEEEKKRTRGSKHLGKKKKFSQSNSNSAQTTLFAKPFDENKTQGNSDDIVLAGCWLALIWVFPL